MSLETIDNCSSVRVLCSGSDRSYWLDMNRLRDPNLLGEHRLEVVEPSSVLELWWVQDGRRDSSSTYSRSSMGRLRPS